MCRIFSHTKSQKKEKKCKIVSRKTLVLIFFLFFYYYLSFRNTWRHTCYNVSRLWTGDAFCSLLNTLKHARECDSCGLYLPSYIHTSKLHLYCSVCVCVCVCVCMCVCVCVYVCICTPLKHVRECCVLGKLI